jgi:hypothetical protein
MQMKSKTAVLVLAAIIATGFLATNLLSISAFAQTLPKSGFGQASKDLATSSPGATGEHSQAGSTTVGSPPNFDNNVDPAGVPGREGIGNVAKNLGIGSVGELGCALDPSLPC